jgi:hypothetical protein
MIDYGHMRRDIPIAIVSTATTIDGCSIRGSSSNEKVHHLGRNDSPSHQLLHHLKDCSSLASSKQPSWEKHFLIVSYRP